jgi:hypothetical protein
LEISEQKWQPEIDWDEDSRLRYKEETAYYTLALKIQE